jgi:hypothetical protein
MWSGSRQSLNSSHSRSSMAPGERRSVPILDLSSNAPTRPAVSRNRLGLDEQKKNLAKRTNRAHWSSGSGAPAPSHFRALDPRRLAAAVACA